MHRTNRNKVFLHAFVLSCTVIFSSMITGLLNVKAESASIPYEFSFGNTLFSGNYEGELLDGVPNGDGTVTLPDGTSFVGIFENGLFEGSVKEISSDGSYYSYKCSEGKPYGKRKQYSKDSKLLSTDWYYNERLISELTSLSVSPDYQELLSDPNSYKQQLFKIAGTVQDIFNDSSYTYILVCDSSGFQSVCTYNNTILTTFTQAWVPNFTVGDQVTLYGTFTLCSTFNKSQLLPVIPGYETNQDTLLNLLNGTMERITLHSDQDFTADQVFNNTLPYFSLFYGEYASVNDRFDPNLPITYDLLSHFPYFYSSEVFKGTGTVYSLTINYETGYSNMLIQESDSKKFFYGTYAFEDKDYFPMIGDQITFKALIKGNKKLDYIDEDTLQRTYLLIPYLHLYKCSEN